jgi:hypothetical protein
MNPVGGRRAQYSWTLALVAVFSTALLAAQTAPQMQPTNSQDAQTIDQTWQRASSKYDSERNALLKEVRRVASDGPYRSD